MGYLVFSENNSMKPRQPVTYQANGELSNNFSDVPRQSHSNIYNATLENVNTLHDTYRHIIIQRVSP